MGNRSYTTTQETTDLEFQLLQNGQPFDAAAVSQVVIYPSYNDAVNETNAVQTITAITHVSTGLYSYIAAIIATAGTYFDKMFLTPVVGGLPQTFINSFAVNVYSGTAMPQFLRSLKLRLSNPAVTDDELNEYIASSMREVNPINYEPDDYYEQVLDTACYKLAVDNKFPEISSISQNGLTTSFSGNDPERFRRRITERRQAVLLGTGANAS
jgi:hypothetical protein